MKLRKWVMRAAAVSASILVLLLSPITAFAAVTSGSPYSDATDSSPAASFYSASSTVGAFYALTAAVPSGVGFGVHITGNGIAVGDNVTVFPYNGTTRLTGSGGTYTSSGMTINFGTNLGQQVTQFEIVDQTNTYYTTGITVTENGFNTAAVPSGLTATAGDKQVSLSWNATSGDSSYNVYQNGTLIQSGVTGTSYTVTGLTDGTQYSFTVSGVDSSGNESAQSTAVTATPQAAATDATPTGLAAAAGDKQVSLSWNATSGDSSYNVYQNGTLIQSGVTGTSYTVTGLTDGTQYSFTVSGVDSSGNESAQSTAATATPTGTLAAPTNVQATGTPGGSGTVTWSDPTAPTGTTYTVQQNGETLGTTTQTSYPLSNYDPNAVYTVSASASGYTATPSGSPSGGGTGLGSVSYGFKAGDVLSNTIKIIASLAGFILLGVSILLTPRLIRLVRASMGGRAQGRRNGRSDSTYEQSYEGPAYDRTYEGVKSSEPISSPSTTITPRRGL